MTGTFNKSLRERSRVETRVGAGSVVKLMSQRFSAGSTVDYYTRTISSLDQAICFGLGIDVASGSGMDSLTGTDSVVGGVSRS